MTKSGEKEEVHSTNTSASNTSGILVDKDEKAHTILNIGAKRRVLSPLVNGDDVARFTGDGEVGEAEARAPGLARFTARERIALGALDGNDILTRVGDVFLSGDDPDRSAWAGDCFSFGDDFSLRLWGSQPATRKCGGRRWIYDCGSGRCQCGCRVWSEET